MATEVPHLLEHLIIELQAQAQNHGVLKGETQWNWRVDPRGTFHVHVEYENEQLVLAAIRLAERIVNTLDKWRDHFKYGSDKVTITADKIEKGTLGAVGYDDEGVKTQKWDLIKDGVLVNYQVIRDQAHILGLKASQGCCYADSWSSVQFQRMANVSLQPGKEKLTPNEMIKNIENGIYIVGDGSFSIDQQRYNAQFGGQLFYEIKNGKVTQPLEDVAYQIRTPEFWNSCVAVCDDKDFRFGGSFFDGKGQPGQVSAVSHGSSTARFNGANVINTARSLG